MIYEWRTYEALPGKLPALHTHLEVAAGLFKTHGLGVLGFWIEERCRGDCPTSMPGSRTIPSGSLRSTG
jgi:hypothetical protein